MATIYVARAYQSAFSTRPHTTLAFTGAFLNALGDVVAQVSQKTISREEHDPPVGYDFVRTLRFFLYGFAISPLLGRWNGFLESRFPLRTIGGSGRVSLRALSKRVLCDQLVMAPIGLVVFIGAMGVMEGRTGKQIRQKYRDLFKPAILANWKVWPVAQLINFRFMPLPYRVPFQSTCGVFWTLYLSLMNAKEDQRQDREAELHRTIS